MDPPTKSARKNKKRKDKKKGHTSTEDLPMTPQNMLSELKKELETVKTKKDHKWVSEIRDQIWVLTDLCAGVRTDIPDEYLAKIISNIPFFAKDPADDSSAIQEPSSSLSEPEKECRKIRKKLKQISELKAKQARGEPIEANQIEKIQSESRLLEELRELEDLLVTLRLRSVTSRINGQGDYLEVCIDEITCTC